MINLTDPSPGVAPRGPARPFHVIYSHNAAARIRHEDPARPVHEDPPRPIKLVDAPPFRCAQRCPTRSYHVIDPHDLTVVRQVDVAHLIYEDPQGLTEPGVQSRPACP